MWKADRTAPRPFRNVTGVVGEIATVIATIEGGVRAPSVLGVLSLLQTVAVAISAFDTGREWCILM